MNDAPRHTLRELIARHGPGLCSDARRCEGLLRDLCGEHRREINILLGALRERVPLDLLAARNSVPTTLLLTRLAKRLEDQLALMEAASSWAVDSWALALGVVSDAELEGIQSRRVEATAPRVETTPSPSHASTRPEAEDETQAGKPATRTGARPTATPPRAQHSPPPPATRTPTVSNPSPSRPPATLGPRPRVRASSTAPTPQHPAPRTPSSAQAANTRGQQEPADAAAPRVGRGRWRGCLIGCFLFVLLSALLAVGVPFVFDVLREEEQQRNLEPPPVQTR